MNRLYNKLNLVTCVLALAISNIYADDLPIAQECYQTDLCAGTYLKAELLYGKTHLEGLEGFANVSQTEELTIVSGVNTLGVAETFGRNHKIHYNWHPGFRIGFGRSFCCCGQEWTAELDWTRIRGLGKGHRSEDSLESRAHWNSNYNVINALAYSPNVCSLSCFNWQFFGGLRYSYIEQHLKALSSARTLSTTEIVGDGALLSASTFLFRAHNKSKFWGIGPEIGLKADYEIRCGFKLFGKLNAAFLYGCYNVRADIRTVTATTSTLSSLLLGNNFLHSKFRKCQVATEFTLGLSWCRTFCLFRKEKSAEVRLAWEHFQWYNANKLGGAVGDLCYDGITLGANIFY